MIVVFFWSSHCYHYLNIVRDPNGDENNNGYSNYADYAMGANPVSHHDPSIEPILLDNTVTFQHRAYTLDVLPIYQMSDNLIQWQDLTKPNHYTIESISHCGVKSNITFALQINPSTHNRAFFRQKLTTPKQE